MNSDGRTHLEPKGAIWARRSFLKALGAWAAALPFYGMLEDSFAQSTSGALPLKFVGVLGFHGTSEKFWARQAGEPLDATISSDRYSINFPDSPFRPFDDPGKYGYSFKNQINIFEGFDYGVGFNEVLNADGVKACRFGISSHGGSGIFLTGSAVTDARYEDINHSLYNASLDQYLAKLYGGKTKFRSLEISGQRLAFQQNGTTIAVGEGGSLLNLMTSPADIFDKFFGSWVAPNDAAAQVEAKRKRAIGKSILDHNIADLTRLQKRLAGTERQKLEQHLTAVRDLERRISTEDPAVVGCKAPVRHAPTGNPNSADNYEIADPSDVRDNPQRLKYLEPVSNMQMELLAEILVCDLTRFATIVLPGQPGTLGSQMTPALYRPADGGSSGLVPTASGIDIDMTIPYDFHLEIAHRYAEGRLENHRAAAAVSRYYHGKVARLMRRLKDAGVLDNTIILVGNEGGHGNHKVTNIPIVMAGGANGAIKMGRRIMAPGRTARIGAAPVATANPTGDISAGSSAAPTSHVPILVAVANAFHKQAGAPEISSYGTCAAYPNLLKGVQGLI